MSGVDAAGQARLKVFISYSRKDEDFAQELLKALELTGFQPFLDKHDIAAGEDWEARLGRLIEAADTVVFVISPDAVASERCAWEVERTLALKKRLLPIVWRRVEDAKVPPNLKRLNYIFFDQPLMSVPALQALSDALKVDVEWIREHTRQAELAARWVERGRPDSLLLRGDTLLLCKAWEGRRSANAPEITDIQREFFNASEEAERRRQSAERQQLDDMRTALEREKAALQKAQAAVRRSQRALAGAVGLFGCIVVGAIGWVNQAYLKEGYYWRAKMRPSVLKAAAERDKAATPGSNFKECKFGCPTMIVLTAGKFIMGSPDSEKGRDKDEGPQREVSIAKPFAVGKTEVTFDEYDACVAAGSCQKPPDSGWGRGDRPVINVSWDDATNYAAWLSRMTGKGYRLLTEAEWEYAARAGNQGRWSFGDDEDQLGEYAWYGGHSNGKTQPVGKKKPNAFGLYDMHGNVWDWVQDCYVASYNDAPTDGGAVPEEPYCSRVLRGGSWGDNPGILRSAQRASYQPDIRDPYIGFRLARTLATAR